jgi:hypothetical protein
LLTPQRKFELDEFSPLFARIQLIKLFGSFFGFREALIGNGVITAGENEVKPAGKVTYDRIKIIVALRRFNPVGETRPSAK